MCMFFCANDCIDVSSCLFFMSWSQTKILACFVQG